MTLTGGNESKFNTLAHDVYTLIYLPLCTLIYVSTIPNMIETNETIQHSREHSRIIARTEYIRKYINTYLYTLLYPCTYM
uniref:Uncharacterized protein n=1 Tax=Rhizophora mucronata TaxID=61149 RepID=A0A2P2PQX4_RHIMU